MYRPATHICACGLALGFASLSLACGPPPTTGEEDSTNATNDSSGEFACGEPQAVQSGSCGDGVVDAGESCLSHAQTIELDNLPGFPQPLRAELIVADLNGDGVLDLMSGRHALIASSTGTFAQVIADSHIVNPRAIELDGKPGAELVWLESIPGDADAPEPSFGHVQVRFELGGADFPSPLPTDMTMGTTIGLDSGWSVSAMDLAVGDINGDGLDDIAALTIGANFDQFLTELTLLTNLGAYGFEQTSLGSSLAGDVNPQWVSAGPIGTDDFDDLFWAGDIFLGGEGSAKTEFSTRDRFGWEASRALLGQDFDCDDVPDLLGGNVNGIVAARGRTADPYFFDGAQELTLPGSDEATEYPVPWAPWDLADLNADGAGDLVLVGPSSVAIAYAESDGRFAQPTPLETRHAWLAARAVDVDVDGVLDLVGVYANPDAHLNSEPISGGVDILLTTP